MAMCSCRAIWTALNCLLWLQQLTYLPVHAATALKLKESDIIEDGCSATEPNTCSAENEEACMAQRVKVEYPDVDIDRFFKPAYTSKLNYECTSQTFCKWAELWTINCGNVYIPDYPVTAAFYRKEEQKCYSVPAQITINQTVSCCHPGMNCSDVFNAIQTEPNNASTYSQHCVSGDSLTHIIEDVVGCYATETFFQYIKCNQSDYENKCPPFFFQNLQTYARCACASLRDSGSNAWAYFAEITELVEAAFSAWRGKKVEKCPPWQFSCNSEGEAILDLYQIECPLDLTTANTSAEVAMLREIIYNRTGALVDDQVQITSVDDEDMLIVKMYSMDNAMDAVDWLSLNTSDDTPIEIIGNECTLNDELVENLNEVYGDPTPAPTDSACKNDLLFAAVIVLSCLVCTIDLTEFV